MNSELKHRYMEEVLGLTPLFGAGGTTAIPVAVECEPLTPETQTLLQKILGSVPIADCPHFEIGSEPIASRHRLRFVGLAGRIERDGVIEWQLPKLSEMLGTAPRVIELKKSAWTLLRQFIQEKPA